MKLRIISLLAITLLLAACRTPPYLTNVKSQSDAVPPEKLPDYQCQGEIPEPLKEKLKDYRLAQEEDFVSAIREYAREAPVKPTCSIFTADFNGDGAKDYAMLLVSKNTSQEKSEEKSAFRFELLVNRGNGQFGTAAVRNYKKANEASDGVVYTSMRLKQAKEKGAANRDRFPLQPGTLDWQSFINQPGIELWRALPLTPDRQPQNLNLSTLAFCSEVFYFVSEKQETAVEANSEKTADEKPATSVEANSEKTADEKPATSASEKPQITVERTLKTASVCD